MWVKSDILEDQVAKERYEVNHMDHKALELYSNDWSNESMTLYYIFYYKLT